MSHELIVQKALVKRADSLSGWLASQLGLAMDVGCHAVAGWLLATAVVEWAPWWVVLLVWPIGAAYYVATDTPWLMARKGATEPLEPMERSEERQP